MKRGRIKKTAIIMIGIGLCLFIPTLFFAYEYFDIRTNGTQVSGVITDINQRRDASGITTYRPVISYVGEAGTTEQYIPPRSSHIRNYQIGDTRELFVYQEKIVEGSLIEALWPLVSFGVLSLIFIVIGSLWYRKHRQPLRKHEYLKRTGKRIQTHFIRSEQTKYKRFNRYGTILFFKEDTGDRIFQSNPIFADLFLSWLETHNFDVYVDPSDSSQYYIDIEKLFGAPTLQ
jgi:hypothetical protein